MQDCKDCVEGIVSQGESIKKVCDTCHGIGKVAEVTPEPEMVEEVVAEVTPEPDESFLGESSDEPVSSEEIV